MKLNTFFKLIIFTVVASLTSCDETTDGIDETTQLNVVDKDQFLVDLKDIEDKLNVDTPAKEDLLKAVTSFQDFASYFPEDDKAADYLLKASDIALTLDQNEKSVKILGKIIISYPEYDQIEAVYYNRASHTDFELRDTALARVYYNEVIEKYPETKSAEDSKTRIDQNFMSPEELIEMWTSNPVEEVVQ